MSAPSNDLYTQAQSITISSFPITGDNTLATTEVGEPTSHYNSLWYLFTSSSDGLLNLTIGNGFAVAVYTNNILSELNPISPIAGSGNNITVQILNGISYSVVIYSVTNISYGAFTFNATFTQIDYPSNDNFSNSTALTGDSFSVSANNSLATKELNETSTNYFSIWYSYTPIQTVYFTITKTTGIALNFKVYNGTSMNNAVLITQGNTTLQFGMTEGITYYIAVSSQNSSTYGALSFTGTIVTQFPLNYIGPITSPSLANNLNGLKSIVYDVNNNAIFSLSNPSGSITINYSTDGGNTWSVDRTISGSTYVTGAQALFLDENGNLVLCFIPYDGATSYYFNVYVRNKITGVWTDTNSNSIDVVQVISFSFSFCQGDDGTIHFVMGYNRNGISNFFNLPNRNIMYVNFKDGVYSTPTPLTQYSLDQDAGFRSLQLVNWNSNIYIFWRVDTDNTNSNGPLKYCQINTTSPLIIDAVFSSTTWITGRGYHVGDIVTNGSSTLYKCLINHSSGVFATDLSNGKWVILSLYTTPIDVTSLVNQDVYNVKSDGTNIYFITAHGGLTQGSHAPLYENFVDITPYTHPFWINGLDLDAFEIATNGDIVVYGKYIAGAGLVVMRIGGVWQTGNQGQGVSATYKNANFCGGHTYNYNTLGF